MQRYRFFCFLTTIGQNLRKVPHFFVILQHEKNDYPSHARGEVKIRKLKSITK
jgi:hypothetical protein